MQSKEELRKEFRGKLFVKAKINGYMINENFITLEKDLYIEWLEEELIEYRNRLERVLDSEGLKWEGDFE